MGSSSSSTQHYMPVLLAKLGLANETECGNMGIAFTDWNTTGPLPKRFQ